MNLIRMISSLNKEDKAIIKLSIDRKHLSAFMKYMQDFKGDFIKVKVTNVNSPCFYGFDEFEGGTVFLKIKTMAAVKDILNRHPGLKELKEFVEGTGILEMYQHEIDALNQIGIGTEIVD